MMLLVPCPYCDVDVPVELIADGDNFRAPDLLPNMSSHATVVHSYIDSSS